MFSTISLWIGRGQGNPKASKTSFSFSPAIGLPSLIRPSLYFSLISFEMAYAASQQLCCAEPVRISRWMPKVDGLAR